jgi:hypothetical protein
MLLVDSARLDEFRATMSTSPYTDEQLGSLHVQRLGYFDVPTADLVAKPPPT